MNGIALDRDHWAAVCANYRNDRRLAGFNRASDTPQVERVGEEWEETMLNTHVGRLDTPDAVIPAKAGIQALVARSCLDNRLARE